MRFVFIICMGLLTLAGCGSDSSDQADLSQTDVKITEDPNHKLYRTAAQKLITEFAGSLQGELQSAIAAGGAPNAINVCQVKAPEIAAEMSSEHWQIKRVTDKHRNPNNRADTTELRFLNAFRDSSEMAPTFLVDWSELAEDSTKSFTYYMPIRTKPLCLKCHGDLQTMGTDVYQVLRKNYPADKATGYKAGDLRGMFVVHAEWPAGTEFANALLSDSLPEPPDSANATSH